MRVAILNEAEGGRSKRWGRTRTGRSFDFELVSYVSVPSIQANGAGDTIRPIWMVIACSEGAVVPVRANLMTGRRFATENEHERFELMRSVPMTWEPQRGPGGTLFTVYQPTPFAFDPGFVDPTEISFVFMPPRAWVEASKAHLGPRAEHAVRFVQRLLRADPSYYSAKIDPAEYVAQAPLFAAMLDRRTRVPLIPDLAFQLYLLCRWYREHQTYSRSVKCLDTEAVGFSEPLLFSTLHEVFEPFVAECSAAYFEALRA